MNNRVTIKDIARHAGVGTTTVSRVLRDHKYVSKEKRTKVLRAIEELDYRPNYNARWLREGATGILGLITDHVATTPYAVDIIRGAQDAASEHEQVLMVMNSNTLDDIRMAVEFLLERQVVGIIYAAMFHREVELPDNIYQVPVALANCYVESNDLPAAVPDEVQGGYQATRQLLMAGHERVAFLNVHPPEIDAASGRLAGYKQALKEFGLPFDRALVGKISDDSLTNYHTTRSFLQRENPPTAFFVFNDRSTLGCYAAVRDAGLRIPEDIGFVGFDNQKDIAENVLPPLTTMQLPHYEMGYWAMNQILVNNEQQTQDKVLLECPLIQRQSV